MVDLIRPILEFDGPIIYVDSIEQSNKICDELLLDSQLTEVGLDTEWPVTYRPGSQAKTAVLQLSTREKCLIFHLSAMESFPPALLRLLVATRITKVGLNIEGDIWKLGIDYEIPAQHINRLCVKDVGQLANSVLNSAQKWSLDGLIRNLMKKRLDKVDSPRLSDWSQRPLSQEQLKYAALDAYASLCVYQELKRRSN